MIRMLQLFGTLTLLAAAGCGPTVGDPCTTNEECGEGLCVNASWAPGGYCSRRCGGGAKEAECPSGSTCVPGALDLTQSVCLRQCTRSEDCRSGYTCNTDMISSQRVCSANVGL